MSFKNQNLQERATAGLVADRSTPPPLPEPGMGNQCKA
jgi:hypothetical protein